MKYSDFEAAISPERMDRYLLACDGDSRKAMTLNRYNLRVSPLSSLDHLLNFSTTRHLFLMSWIR